jgi:hypothetical protein
LGVDLCELALCEGDFAVVAEAVSIDGQGVFWPVVFFNGIVVGVAELAAGVIFFYGGPAGLAGVAVDGRGVFDAIQAVGNRPGKVAVRAISFLQRLLHRVVLLDEAFVRRTRPSIIRRTCAFASKKWGFGEVATAVSHWWICGKKIFEIMDFSAQLPAQMIDFRGGGEAGFGVDKDCVIVNNR